MATAAILVALSTSITIASLPHQVPQQLGDGICPTCDPSTVVVPTNLRHEYYFKESVSGAGDGASALWFVPLVGVVLGVLRGHLRYYSPPAALPSTGVTSRRIR